MILMKLIVIRALDAVQEVHELQDLTCVYKCMYNMSYSYIYVYICLSLYIYIYIYIQREIESITRISIVQEVHELQDLAIKMKIRIVLLMIILLISILE